MNKKQKQTKQRRIYKVRKKVRGTVERPRLSVFRSNRNISAQIIDDFNGVTLVSASSLQEDVKSDIKVAGNVEAAKAVGAILGKRATELGIRAVRFDRGSYKYHGRVKALADAAKEAGLVF